MLTWTGIVNNVACPLFDTRSGVEAYSTYGHVIRMGHAGLA